MREALAQAEVQLSPRAFEDLARSVVGNYLDVPLKPGQVSGVPKEFDLVSPDGSIVGDAKYFTLVRGQRLPPAVFHHREACLAAGQDRRADHVPRLWER
jgi:hypothetical protein